MSHICISVLVLYQHDDLFGDFVILTRSIRDSETSIDFVQGPPGSRRELGKNVLLFPTHLNMYQAFNGRKIKNLFMVSARLCEIYFILQVFLYTFDNCNTCKKTMKFIAKKYRNP